MELLLGNQRRGKIILVSLMALIVFLFVGLFKLITGSFIVGVLIFVALMYFLLRMVGIFVMYPGSSFYTRSDIEIRMSGDISNRMVLFFNSMHFLHVCVAQRKFLAQQSRHDLVVTIINHIATMKEVLGMFESSLSSRKIKMFNLYRQLDDLVEQKRQEDAFSIKDFIHKPRVIDGLDEAASTYYRQKFDRIQEIMKDLHTMIKSFSPPDGTFASLKFRMFQQNLYELRFAFHTWGTAYNYQLAFVPTSQGDMIETAVIHNVIRKSYMTGQVITKPNESKKSVLFCNPNGVFIQFFGYDNEYIRNYLKQGYNVILWNYRGYGQSTGNPTIIKSQLDASNVFKFYHEKGYDIQVVHGYSIGGAAAVGIFDKVPNNSLEDIDILIIDRSFSSIGQMSVQFGSTLHSITKLLFLGDNIDLSKQFQDVKCRKLLIWDNLDEVIPDRASLKNRIIKRKCGKSNKKSIYGFDEDLEINQLNEDDVADPDFENLTNKLAFTVRELLNHKINLDDNNNPDVTFEKEENSTNSVSTSVPEADGIDFLVSIVNEIDGGGIEILKEIQEMQAILARRPDKFHHICESYVLGIFCYGSYFPLGPFIHNHKKIKQQTLQKLQRAMVKLQQRFKMDVGEPNLIFQKSSALDNLAQNMYHIYFRVSNLITDYFSQEWFTLHGSLLPTNNGHNCNLTEQQIFILNDFIKTSAPQEMVEPQSMSDQQML